MPRWFAFLLVLGTASAGRSAEPPKTLTAEQLEFFEKKVRPILAEQCYSCHGPKKQQAGLRLDSAAGLRAGADGAAVVIAGDPAKSRLIRSVKREGDYPMPPKAPLPAEAVATLTEWVKAGAYYPEDAAKTAAGDPRQHWAFQPVRALQAPVIANSASAINNPIDAFVLAKLNEKHLTQAPPADRRSLARRAYFDLTGLPPAAADLDAFEADKDPDAWEKLIDKLLASPAYGERWGRYWLDLARYADTKGYVFQEDRNYPFAFTYRDYVVRSLNEDKPYDRFVMEQLAADRLVAKDSADQRPLAALGFLTLGRRFLNSTPDIIDDRIDVVTRGLMGLTVGCARCHDHKFDPVPIADYYSLYGIFASTNEPKDLPLIGEVKRTPEVIAFEKEVEKREAEYQTQVERRFNTQIKKLRRPATIAEYIRAVIETRDRGGRGDRGGQAIARERDLNPYALSRWRAFLAAELKNWSPVYGPLMLLADIPEKEFVEKSPELLSKLAKDPKRPVNRHVLGALTEKKLESFKATVEVIAVLIAPSDLVGPPSEAEAQLRSVWQAGGPLDIPVADLQKIQDRADRDALAVARRKIEEFKAASPFALPRAHVLYDNPQPTQPVVFLRGNPNSHGPSVPRQIPAIAAVSGRKPFTDGSGRLELAKAIVSPDNPLTARVFVNRVWAGHFGAGLVRTPSDFGTRSDPPSHPELLDYLAATFVQNGWSIKKLHKLIMLSATYQQSSQVSAEVYKLDPENRLLSHQTRRRLDFEAMRDSILAAAGTLDRTTGGKPVDLFKAPFSSRRSIYGFIDRTNFPGTMRAFDVASPDQHAPKRFQTTVAQQALFLMNSPFVAQQAKTLAGRSEVTGSKNDREKAIALYRLTLGRSPTSSELGLALEFIAGTPEAGDFGRWPQLAQVLLLSNSFAFVD